MLKFGNKEFRNLQEQVYKNMKDILFILQEEGVLNEFGIKVVGQETSYANMPTVEDYKEDNPEWSYGDAYAIGTESPYSLYILTRANGTHPNDYWFNIGSFPVPGPQGPQGPQGETGPQGPTGNQGSDGLDAGFGTISATAETVSSTDPATVTVTTSGPNTAKNISFAFEIPQGEKGDDGAGEWGEITGDIANQTDLITVLQGKQNTLVSGTNIKTINNESILGSGNITIQGGKPSVADFTAGPGIAIDEDLAHDTVSIEVDQSSIPFKVDLSSVAFSGSYTDLSNKPSIPSVSGTNDGTNWTSITINSDTYAIPQGGGTGTVTDVEVNGTSVVDAQGVAEITVPTKTSDLTNDSGFITNSALSGYATETYVQNYHDSTKQDVISDLSTIRAGASLGATAVQPSAISDMATKTWVGQQGYITGITSSDVTTALGYTPGTSNFSGDYDDLTNKPTIPTVNDAVLTIQKNGTTVNTFTANASSNVTANIIVPTLTSDLTNDSGFITGITSSDVTSALGYTPGTSNFSGAYADLTGKPTIPTNTSDLNNDSGFITSSALSGYATQTWVGQQGYQTASDVSTTLSAYSTTSAMNTAISTAISSQTKETWTFTLNDGTTITKTIVLG